MTRVIVAKLKKIQYWVAGAAIAMVLVGAVYAHAQSKNLLGAFGDTANINDDLYIQAVKNLTKSVPKNETLVVTANSAVIKYFSDHPVKVPWRGKVTSEKTLVTWMSNIGYKYLVVVYTHGRGTSIAELNQYFQIKG